MSYYLKFILFILLTSLFHIKTYADPIDECYKDSDNRIEVSKCLDDKLSKSEISLDGKVSAVRKDMQKLSKEINNIYPLRSFNLSQQAFLLYRKSNCDWFYDKSYPNGGSGDVLKDCLIRMNLDRIIELDRDYKFEPSEQKSSPVNSNKKGSKAYNRTEENGSKTITESNTKGSSSYDNSGYVEYEQPKNENLPDDCYQVPDPGDCNAKLLRYYYYQEIGKCRAFLWSGCGGVVPFETMSECREVCVQIN